MITSTKTPRGAATRLHRLRRIRLASLAWIVFCGTGCQGMYFLFPEKKELRTAECNQITNQRVGVLVWAEQATLDYDALARVRVGKTVTFYLKKNLPEASFVDPMTVARMQDRGAIDWEGMSNTELCKELKCDMLLRIDLLEYTTRALSARELRKGRVRGTVNLYSTNESAGSDPVYRSEVVATYPPASTQGVLDQTDEDILRATVDEFGLEVARKFYAYEISYTETGKRRDRRDEK